MIRKEKLSLPGFEMYYGRFGTGKKNLVIIPGLSVKNTTDQIGAVERAYRELGENYTVYLFDRREDPPTGYGFREMSEDTAAAMDMLGIERTSICGCSQGGMISLCIAMRYPEKLEKLILVSTCYKTESIFSKTLSEWIGLARKGDSKELNRAFVERVFGEKTLEKCHDMLLSVSPDYTEKELQRFTVLAETMLDMDLEREFNEKPESIRCPTLVIGCEADRVVGPEGSRELARRLGGELFMYGSEYGHALYDEAPDYIGRLKTFLEK